jgi:protein TonB
MHAHSPFAFDERPRRVSIAGLATVVGLHAAALFTLLHYAPLREALGASVPIMVNLITPPSVEVAPPNPQIDPPKPAPSPPRKVPALAPIVAAPVESPSAVAAPAPPAETRPPVEAPQPAAAPKVASAGPALPVVPPSFSADYLHNPAPTYPALSRRMGEQGKVVLHVLVTAEGVPERVELRTSSGSARLDGVALGTVKRWKFVPARQGDRPVAAWVLVPISFALEG